MCMDIEVNTPDKLFNYKMYNVLGPENISGKYHYSNQLGLFSDNFPYFVDYHKSETRPYRKMGHLTFVSKDLTKLLSDSVSYKNALSIKKGECKHKVGIVMGSISDNEIMRKAVDILKHLGIEYEHTIVSAHRTPDRLTEYAKSAKERGLTVIIAGAGGAAHLPGMLASMTCVPVIGVPIKTKSLKGVDSLYSIVQMPEGVPVGCMSINGAQNAGLYAASLIGINDEVIYQRLMDYKKKMKCDVLESCMSLVTK